MERFIWNYTKTAKVKLSAITEFRIETYRRDGKEVHDVVACVNDDTHYIYDGVPSIDMARAFVDQLASETTDG